MRAGQCGLLVVKCGPRLPEPGNEMVRGYFLKIGVRALRLFTSFISFESRFVLSGFFCFEIGLCVT
jgi:hypothetical protein